MLSPGQQVWQVEDRVQVGVNLLDVADVILGDGGNSVGVGRLAYCLMPAVMVGSFLRRAVLVPWQKVVGEGPTGDLHGVTEEFFDVTLSKLLDMVEEYAGKFFMRQREAKTTLNIIYDHSPNYVYLIRKCCCDLTDSGLLYS